MSGAFPFVYQPLTARDGDGEGNQFANAPNVQPLQPGAGHQAQAHHLPQQPPMMMHGPPMMGAGPNGPMALMPPMHPPMMQPPPYPYPAYPMQMPPGQLPTMSSFPPGTVLYMPSSQSFVQAPLVLSKPPELDPSSHTGGGWPTFVPMQTTQPPAVAVPSGDRGVEGQALVNSSSDSARWEEGSPVSAEIFKKRKRYLFLVLFLISIVCLVFTTVAVSAPAAVFKCSPRPYPTRSSTQVAVSIGYFQYCSSVTVSDFNYHQSICRKYPDHLSYNAGLPQLPLSNQGNTKIAQAFAIISVVSLVIMFVTLLLQLRVDRPRVLQIVLAIFCVINLASQIASVVVMIKEASTPSTYSIFGLTGCSPTLLYGSVFQIIVMVLDVPMAILAILSAINRISFVGIFKKEQQDVNVSA